MRRALRAGALGALLCAIGAPAFAAIPLPETIARAVADASRAQGRARAFTFAVKARPGAADEDTAGGFTAEGELVADPAGQVRLALRHQDGFVERQLRRGGGLTAARDGEPIEGPHPLAPPFWVLQASTGGALLAWLGELGGDPAQVALGYDGSHDCYVLGGKARGASIWIDKDTQQVVRIDLGDGTTYRFLVWTARGGALLPGRIELETPVLSFVLELSSAAPVTPAADAFSEAWLLGRDPQKGAEKPRGR
jgi:hypothetical protein